MKYVLPAQPVDEHADIRIPMSDGVSLAARLWLPQSAHGEPVPALLEYIPYRQRDFTATRDEIMHPWFAGHGYGCIRVDLRGSGDSGGVLKDEYLEQELQDGLEVIRWLARQPWCNGRVGMIGKSWGGFNGLQLAWLQPEALRAVVTVCSTDDRYADDVHYMGGCLLGDNLSWASTMFAYNSCPPDPEQVGDDWHDLWMKRLEHSGIWLENWLEHQARDDYWRHGSICEDFSRIQCPVMAVSGWADGYSNAVFRLMENLEVPRLGLVGPWSHKYPHEGVPGPAIGFLQECLRWWDYWLKDKESGIMAEPMLRLWMQDSMPPHTSYRERFGRWVGETAWPSPAVIMQRYRFAHKLLVPADDYGSNLPHKNELFLQSPLSLGLFAGKWCSYSATPDLPHDQREEDGGALIFDSHILDQTIEILGSPAVTVTFSSDKPQAMLCVRLSDIAPDNKATRVTYGLLNLAHRDGHANPQSLEPGRKYTVTVPLNYIAQQLPEGHCFRVALSTSYFPLAWPSPESPRLTIYPEECHLALPIRDASTAADENVAFQEPEGCEPGPVRQLTPQVSNWIVERDLASNKSTLKVIKDDGQWHLSNTNLTVGNKTLEWYSFVGDDYGSLLGETHWERSFRRQDWQVRTVTRTRLTSDTTHFRIRSELDAYLDETRVYSLNRDHQIRRTLL